MPVSITCMVYPPGSDYNGCLLSFILVTSPKMDKIYSLEEKKTSALLMLEYVLRETSFDPEYLTNTFMKKALVNTKEG